MSASTPNDFKIMTRSNRAKRTNGRERGVKAAMLFAREIDGRKPWARRYRDLCAEMVTDLGGLQHVSEARMVLVRRAAVLAVECEQIERRIAVGEHGEMDRLLDMTRIIVAIFSRLGLGGRAAPEPEERPPSIADLVARHGRPGGGT